MEMIDRPILRLPEASRGERLKGSPDRRRRPQGVGTQGQASKYESVFSRLEEAFTGENPGIVLRQTPDGIAPERALVFETISSVSDFQRAAKSAGFELLIEERLNEDFTIPDDMVDAYVAAASPTLYAVMPTIKDLEKLLSLWNAYVRGDRAPRGQAPWWKLFSLLSDIRVWGPKDRLTELARANLQFELENKGDEPIHLELEFWPTENRELRSIWSQEATRRVRELGGNILATSSIAETGLNYEAILAAIPAVAVREMLEHPSAEGGIATLDGLQFVLPQTIAQAFPGQSDEIEGSALPEFEAFDEQTPIRAILLDGTPVAAHPALLGGVVVEDVHGLVGLSEVRQRKHATAMASLILRGELIADGAPVLDGRLLSIPVLIDTEYGAVSPSDRLFIDIIHTSLARAFLGDEPLAPDAHVVNLSIGINRAHFSGRLSSLARVLDWWSERFGILFVISAGNIGDDLIIRNTRSNDFEDGDVEFKRNLVEDAQRSNRHDRTLLAPAEAMNALTVGAASQDFIRPTFPRPAGVVEIAPDDEIVPAIYSAFGLGPFRSIKPDFLAPGGQHEIRCLPALSDVRLKIESKSQRTGLTVAGTNLPGTPTVRSRGTSCATALTTRAIVQSAAAQTLPNGPYEGTLLSPRDKALLTKALSVHSARWSAGALSRFDRERARLGENKILEAREEVCRYYGHGFLNDRLMLEAPSDGATLIGLGSLRKDRAAVFEVPLPPALSGQRAERELIVTVAWFSPVKSSRAQYRLAILEAVIDGEDDEGQATADTSWGLRLKGHQLDARQLTRGTVWSRRLTANQTVAPTYAPDASLPLRVQCRDGAQGGLHRDDEIPFALAVSLMVDINAGIDVYEEIQQRLRVQARSNPG